MAGTNYMKTFISGTLLAAGIVCAETPQYNPERYDVILDRSPFGSDPLLDVNPEQKAAAAAAAAAKELRLCFLLESESGEIRAGFQNLKAKAGDPKSIILMVGESFMGMKLLEIDLAGSQATLESRGEPVVFELSKAPAPAKAPAKKAPPPKRKFGGGFRRREPPKQPPARPPEPQLSPEEQQRRREEVRANLQDYQMEVIRSGMPPLPIPLTQEMDDQLVSEGVLPPGEGQEDLLPE
ncbi:MAG: hypothetical protein ABFR33_09755 [Verrucomicrobiota bacterium]